VPTAHRCLPVKEYMSRLSELEDEPFSLLCRALAAHAAEVDANAVWPAAQLSLLADAGVFAWFVPENQAPEPLWSGQGWSETELLQAYERLAQACLTTTFIVTQRQAAVSRIVASPNKELANRLLPALIRGETFATVGISHLTTSRRHATVPVLRATQRSGGYLLDGMSPWVTGAAHAQWLVLGATLSDGRQLLAAVPSDSDGLHVAPVEKLVALSGSHTGPVLLENVFVPESCLLAGPVPEVMKLALGARTGGLQTSTLALGLARAAIEFLQGEAGRRPELNPPTQSLQEEIAALHDDLLLLAGGPVKLSPELHGNACGTSGPTPENVRSRANSLVLRATQAALVAAKGAGFVAGHPAGRWCREALFFLVWSCPPAVAAANLCELAGLGAE
jgi:alkylation response protein AidB-like acyl-CoA dehydrogenase